MLRSLASALLVLAAAPAWSASGIAEDCAVTSAIVAQAVAQRKGGAAQPDAIAALAEGDIEARFVPAVQPLVEWVYTLPQDQLTDEAAAAFEAACVQQPG